MTNDGVHSYSYDADGNILAVNSGSTATYLYNALNQRVRTTVGSTITDITFNAAGQRVSMWNGTTGAQIQGQYYWRSTPVAFYKGGATHFQHQDRQGSERVRTTYNGAVEGSFAFLPFGDAQTVYSGTDLDPYHYAQLDYDAETNTDHAQFRQYNDTQGRWMRPDPYSGSYDSSNPQSFNRYSYLLNNPLASVDPLGLDGCGGENGPKPNVVAHDGSGVHAEESDGGVDPCDVGITSGGPCGSGDPSGGNNSGSAYSPGSIVQDKDGNIYIVGAGGVLISFFYGSGIGSAGCNLTDLSCQVQYQSLTQHIGPTVIAPSKGQTLSETWQAAKSCAGSSFGLSTAAAGGAVAAGTNALSTAGKFAGMTPGTSVASSFFRAALPQAIESTWAPTLMNPLATSGVLGGVVGRWVPVVGEAILIWQGAQFLACYGDSDPNW